MRFIVTSLVILTLSLSAIAKNKVTNQIYVNITLSKDSIEYQGDVYQLMLFDSVKCFDQLGISRATIPDYSLPERADVRKCIAFFDKEFHHPAIIINYNNRVKDGLFTLFYPSGYPYISMNFSKGNLDGFLLEYDESGNLRSLKQYKDGYHEGPSLSFYDPSHPAVVCYHKNNELDGEYHEWGWNNEGVYELIEYAVYQEGRIIKY